jgi:hypothetical protein
MFMGQSVTVAQPPHVPLDVHTGVLWLLVQSVHVPPPPLGPQFMLLMATQLPELQQKPMPHGPSPLPPHAFWHMPPLHVGLLPEHGWHALPFCPQASLSPPETQVVPLQQPPLHGRPPAHDVEHWWAELHASPEGQSFAPLHPHTPCTH